MHELDQEITNWFGASCFISKYAADYWIYTFKSWGASVRDASAAGDYKFLIVDDRLPGIKCFQPLLANQTIQLTSDFMRLNRRHRLVTICDTLAAPRVAKYAAAYNVELLGSMRDADRLGCTKE